MHAARTPFVVCKILSFVKFCVELLRLVLLPCCAVLVGYRLVLQHVLSEFSLQSTLATHSA